MWTAKEELDIEKARDSASKLVVLGSAFRAGIFEALDKEKDIASLEKELHAEKRALYIVLEALAAMGYVNKRNGKYVISEKARPLFLEKGEDYAGGFLPHFLDIMKAWLELPEIIRGKKPEEKRGDVSAFMHAMASRPDKNVEETVESILKRKKDAKTVLDLGGGPGKYARAFVNRGLNAVLYDMPEVIEYVSREFGLEGIRNLTLKSGDFTESGFENEFEGEYFDIIFMGNICHIYSPEENSMLIKRVSRLLMHEGMIAIEDFVRGRSTMAELFAVNMLANTEGGSTYTEGQYREWLEKAGFREIRVIDLEEKERQLITAFK